MYQIIKNVSIVKVEHNLHVSDVDIVIPATGRGRNWRVQLETSATTANYTNVGKYSPAASTTIIKHSPSAPFKQRLQQQEKVIDVYGQGTEPICGYRRCHHKFSEHGHNCKCHHALNYATGVSILPLTKI